MIWVRDGIALLPAPAPRTAAKACGIIARRRIMYDDAQGVAMAEAAKWVRVAGVKQVAEGEMLATEAGGRKIAVIHLENGDWSAIENVCTHAYALLTDGWLDGDSVECPLHAGRFDVRTGKALCAPVDEDVATFPVRVEGADVLVGLPD
jgi:nitrite reductase/ring-hydroxylating ferredoxin subunit